MIFLTRRATFSASHYYWNESWSAEQNEQIFGRCANRNGHGHNYTLEVTVAGEPDPVTGFVVDLKWLKDAIEREVLAAYDHRHLNLEVPEFRKAIPTTENISIAIWKRLEPAIAAANGATLARVRVYETPEIFAEYRGPRDLPKPDGQLRGRSDETTRENLTRASEQPIAHRESENMEPEVEIKPRWEEFQEGDE